MERGWEYEKEEKGELREREQRKGLESGGEGLCSFSEQPVNS